MTPPPKKEDPWEARERQREQWRRAAERRSGGGSRRSSRSSGSSGSGGDSDSLWEDATGSDRGLREDYVVWGVLAVIGILLFSEVPNFSGLAREQMARLATLLLLLLLGAARGVQDSFRVAWRRGPNPAILLLAGWAIFETVRAPFHSFAIADLLRVMDGVGVYFLCAYCLKAPRQTGFVAAGTIAIGVCLSLYDISKAGHHGLGEHLNMHGDNFLGTHESAGSLLVLLLPIALIFAVSAGIEEKRRLAAAAATMILGVAELLARTRSAWIGGLAALTVLALLAIKFPNDDPRGAPTSSRRSSRSGRSGRWSARDLIASPAALLAVAMFLFLTVAGAAPFVLHRFVSIHSALDDASFTGRVEMWSGAARMASERPVTGWGLGTYPIIEADWTHSGVDKSEALQVGVGNDNNAHDYYLQWMADTGGVGLALYVAVLALFFAAALRALPRVTAPPQRALLCGCIATVAGAIIDGLASPAYSFHGVSTVLWCALGLGVAAMRPLPPRNAPETNPGPALDPLPIPLYLLSALIGVGAAAAVVFGGLAIVHHGTTLPRGTLEIAAEPTHPVAPGETIRWTARFHDAHNRDFPTAAGTLWHLVASDGGANELAVEHIKSSLAESETPNSDIRHGILQVVTPTLAPGPKGEQPQLIMTALYRDTYGRQYIAYSRVDVRVLSGKR